VVSCREMYARPRDQIKLCFLDTRIESRCGTNWFVRHFAINERDYPKRPTFQDLAIKGRHCISSRHKTRLEQVQDAPYHCVREAVSLMRIRGVMFILAAIPAWVYFASVHRALMHSPWGYELGCVAAPFPPELASIQMFAFYSPLIGIALLVFDFVRWRRSSRRTQTVA
jgi:hypothetical protein